MKDKWKTNDTAAFEARLYDMLGIATVEDDDEDDLLQLIVADLEGQLLAEQEDARLLAAELKQQKKAATEEIQSLAESNIFLRNRVDDINKDKAILTKELKECIAYWAQESNKWWATRAEQLSDSCIDPRLSGERNIQTCHQHCHEIDELKRQAKAFEEQGRSLAMKNDHLQKIVDDINKKANGCATVLGEKRGTIHRIIDALGIEAEVYDCRKIVDAITKLKEEKDLLRARLEPYEAVYDKLMAGVMGRRHLKAPIGDKIATLMLVVEALGIDANICDRDKIIDAIEKLKAIRAHVRFEDGLESKVGQGESVFLVDLDKKGKVKGQVSVTVS